MTAPAGAAGAAARKETAATTLRPIRVLPIPQHRPPVVMAEELPALPLPASPDAGGKPDAGPRYVQDALAVDFSSASDATPCGSFASSINMTGRPSRTG